MIRFRTSRLPRVPVLLSAAVLLWSVAVPGSAGAARSVKEYTLTTFPPTGPISSGITFTATLRLANSSGSTIDLGAADVTIPAGLASTAALTSSSLASNMGRSWSASLVSGVIQLRANGGTQKLVPGDYVDVSFTATAPCVTTSTDYLFESIAWPSTIPGTSTFRLIGSVPKVTVVPGGNVATKLEITSVNVPGTPEPLLMVGGGWVAEPGVAFDVVVETDAPVCSDTPVTLTSVPAGLTAQTDLFIPAGGSSVTIQATYPEAGTGVDIYATASGLDQGYTQINLATASASGASTGTELTLQAGGTTPSAATAAAATAETSSGGEGTCDTDAANPTCAFITLPDGTNGVDAFLFLFECVGFGGLTAAQCDGELIITFTGDAGVFANYNTLNFYMLTVECDRTVCRGGGVTHYVSSFDRTNTGTQFVESPACTSSVNDAVDPPEPGFCTDYNSSHRDNSQDLILVHRLAVDPSRK